MTKQCVCNNNDDELIVQIINDEYLHSMYLSTRSIQQLRDMVNEWFEYTDYQLTLLEKYWYEDDDIPDEM